MNPIVFQPVVEFVVIKTVMDHLLVNKTVQLLVERTTQWGQYGRRKQSLCSANGCAGCVLGACTNTVPYRGALRRD